MRKCTAGCQFGGCSPSGPQQLTAEATSQPAGNEECKQGVLTCAALQLTC